MSLSSSRLPLQSQHWIDNSREQHFSLESIFSTQNNSPPSPQQFSAVIHVSPTPAQPASNRNTKKRWEGVIYLVHANAPNTCTPGRASHKRKKHQFLRTHTQHAHEFYTTRRFDATKYEDALGQQHLCKLTSHPAYVRQACNGIELFRDARIEPIKRLDICRF